MEWGTCVAQSVKHLTSAQVMISQLVGLNPTLGSVLTAQSLEPASDSLSLSSLHLPRLCSVSVSLKNKHFKKVKNKKEENGSHL